MQNSIQKTIRQQADPKAERGFTLIELLISVAVLSIVSTAVFIGYRTASLNAELKTAAFQVVDVLNLAKTRTVASLAASQYGVHLEQNQYALFKGATYDALDPNTIFYAIPPSVEIVSIALAGGSSDVVFDRLTGNTVNSGSFAVRLISNATSAKTVTVSVSGRADIVTAALPPTGTRVSDSRHVHFTYDQNVSSAVTLALDYPGYTTYNIDFQTYFSGGVFDWSGTVSVGGVSQVLRIHTHSTSGLSAAFSVTRDLRYNDKELDIYLDGQHLLRYTAAGVVSLGSSVFVSGLAAQ